MIRLIALLSLLCLPTLIAAQQPINSDSLLQVLAQAPKDTSKVKLYESLAGYYLKNNQDSTRYFALKGHSLAKELNFSMGEIRCLNVLGNFYERKTQYDSAYLYYNEALDISRKNNSTEGLAIVLSNLGIVKTREGKYKEAIDLYFEALEAEEKQGNRVGIAQAYINIGVVYYNLQNIEKTLKYLEKASKIAVEEKAETVAKQCFNNLGALYTYQKKYDLALKTYQRALALSEKLNDKMEMSINLNNIAITYQKTKDYEKAEHYHNKALSLKEELGDFRGMAYSYFTLAGVEKDRKNFARAEELYLQGMKIAQEKKIKKVVVEGYKSLSLLYENQGALKKSLTALKTYLELKDSLFSAEQAQFAAEAEAKYETKKKENEILAQRAKIAEKDLSIARKNRQIILFSAIGLVILLLAILLISRQRLRNQKLQKENELKDALAEIELQQQLENQRSKISRELHDNIASQLSFVISSVQNLKYAFQLKDPKKLQKIQSISSFTKTTAQELRDTIWAMNKGRISFEDMQQRLQNYLSQAEEMTSEIAFSFDWDPNIPADYEFSALAGMNIYRIVQEAVHNSLKYAAASKISVHIHETKAVFCILIEDNGQGFDPDLVERGHGLFNMEKRAEEIGAVLELESRPGAGTKISLQLNSNNHNAS